MIREGGIAAAVNRLAQRAEAGAERQDSGLAARPHNPGAVLFRRCSNITAPQQRILKDSCQVCPFTLQKLLCTAKALG